MKNILAIIFLFNTTITCYGQTSATLISATKLDSLIKTVREFSGEDSCLVGGSKVKIINRVSSTGNDLAGDYLVERLNKIGVTVTDEVYSAKGRNVYGKQIGSTHSDSLVIIGCHYDAVADYCADDNASGVGILLEAARILRKYQFNKTIVYAFWDEEETGLVGSKHHALQVNNGSDKIVAVLNIDMAAYDGNNDGAFDIDLNSNQGSVKMKNDLIAIDQANNLNIAPKVVQPGTLDSDHSSFWNYGYPGVLLGESWETNDQNPKYHTAQDRISLFNLPYYHEIAKLAIAYIGQTAEPVSGVSTGKYIAEDVTTYFNPVTSNLLVTTQENSTVKLFDLKGQLLMHQQLGSGQNEIDLNSLPQGMYLLNLYFETTGITRGKKIIKR